MLTGILEPLPRGQMWHWTHDIISGDDGLPMNVDGALFVVNVTSTRFPCLDYGRRFWGDLLALSCCGSSQVVRLNNLPAGGVLVAQQGTIVTIVPGIMTLSWPLGELRVTLDVERFGENTRLADLIQPVTGF